MLLTASNNWPAYLGHFHPVVVHLPIGILFIAFVFELLVWRKSNITMPDQVVLLCLGLGCLTAIISCLFGWFLSKEGGYEENTLTAHQWMGIAVAVISGVCWLLKKQASQKAKGNTIYRSVLGALLLLLIITGHLGGNMTHGADYLTSSMPAPFSTWLGITAKKDSIKPRAPIGNIKEALVYADLVVPVLEEKCYNCHSSKKIKGGLRMDEERYLFKGGKHGVVIKPGNTEGSELIHRIMLPESDDKKMAPKDEPQLSKDETALLTWWIAHGADTKKKVKELSPDTAAMAMLVSFAQPGADTSSVIHEPLSKVFDAVVSAASQPAIDTLRKLGLLISPVAADKKNLLQISAVNYPAFNDQTATLLQTLAPNIIWLKLDRTQLSDEAIIRFAGFKNMLRLSISGTAVSGAGLSKLAQLPNLEYLNITGTKVDDKGLLSVAAIPSMKRIYCWGSQVTPAAVEQVRKKYPQLKIDNGDTDNPPSK